MSRRHRAVVAALALLLAASLTACTGDRAGAPQGTATPTPTTTATGAAPSLRERAAPYQVRYRQVAGEVSRRRQYLRALARPVRTWVDGGFVRGPWPREDGFARAFVPFGRYISDRARRDAGLLTLQALGGSLVEVIPQRRRIAISVTGARGHVVGATARVDLRVLGLDRSGRRTRVNVRGDLFLTRVKSHGWKVFGYQLDRWIEEGAMVGGGG
jgi:hypothetical protein